MKVITEYLTRTDTSSESLNHPSVNEGDHPSAARSDRRGGPDSILINLLRWFSWLACRPIEVSLFHAPDRILASPDTPGDGGFPRLFGPGHSFVTSTGYLLEFDLEFPGRSIDSGKCIVKPGSGNSSQTNSLNLPFQEIN